jgi:hypothetical protein
MICRNLQRNFARIPPETKKRSICLSNSLFFVYDMADTSYVGIGIWNGSDSNCAILKTDISDSIANCDTTAGGEAIEMYSSFTT